MSNITETINLIGEVNIIINDTKTNIFREYNFNNCIVNVGCNLLASRFGGESIYSLIGKISLGTGKSSTLPSMTSLETPINDAETTITTIVSGNMITYTGIFSSEKRLFINEMGLFNSDISPKMFSRLSLYEPVVKNIGEEMAIRWTIKFNTTCQGSV